MKSKIIMLAALTAGLVFGTAGFAASAPAAANNAAGFYGTVFGGAAWLLNSDVNLSGNQTGKFKFSYKTGYDVGAAVGYNFGNNFRAEGAVSYVNNDIDKVKASGRKDASANGEASLVPVMVNGYYDFTQVSKQFVPYVGAGIGGAHMTFSSKDSGISSDHANFFAYQAIAGVAYHFDSQLSASLDYRFLGTSDAKIKDTGKTYKIDYYNNLLNLGLTYNFS